MIDLSGNDRNGLMAQFENALTLSCWFRENFVFLQRHIKNIKQ